MEPRIEIQTFSDGRLKVMMRFFKNSNFWINNNEEATWVPRFEEIEPLVETLCVINAHNEEKRKLPYNHQFVVRTVRLNPQVDEKESVTKQT